MVICHFEVKLCYVFFFFAFFFCFHTINQKGKTWNRV